MAVERRSLLGRYGTLDTYLGDRLYLSGLNWARFTRGLKWPTVLLTAVLTVFWLIASPIVKWPGSSAMAKPALTESTDPSLRPGAYSGANLVWAKLNQAHLVGASLQRATLLGADISEADLRQARLEGASLLGANLRWAHLEGATLSRANLHWADLGDADLRGADLRWANLAGANLQDVNLQEANLRYANLEKASLRGVILPDGSKWKLSSDLRRFTDPRHPDFWPAGDRYPTALGMRHLPEPSLTR